MNRTTGNRGTGRHRAYTTNGNIIQPFVFTGYQEDDISGLHYAQARYYSAESGRFVSEDLVRGFIEAPQTLNHYLYCWNEPLQLIDLNGLLPEWVKGIADAAAATLSVGMVVAGAVTIATTAAPLVVGTALIGAGVASLGYVWNATDKGGHVNVAEYVKSSIIGGSVGAFLGVGGVRTAVNSVVGGVLGGTINAAMGGSFKDGFLSAAIDTAVTSYVGIPVVADFLGGASGVLMGDISSGRVDDGIGMRMLAGGFIQMGMSSVFTTGTKVAAKSETSMGGKKYAGWNVSSIIRSKLLRYK